MADLKEARVPDIGSENVPVIEVLVKPGDRVAKEQGLVTLESDKATMEVPAPFAGIVKEVKLKVGDEASEGTLIAIIEVEGEGAAAAPKQAAPAKAEAPAKAAPAPAPAAAPVAAPAASGGVREVLVPDIGSADVPVIEILVKVGDTIAKDQGLITLESDKATMEVPAPFAGVVKELKVKIGDELSEGSLIALVETAGGAPAAAPAPQAPAPAKVAAPQVEEKPAPIGGRSVLPGNAPEGDVPPSVRPPFDSGIIMPGDAPLCQSRHPCFRARAGRGRASGEGQRPRRPHPA
jgi:pyruvate dehydrogenase E2 component (dihydrolipoamide acetyltransferase)